MEFEAKVFKVLPPVSGTSARGQWTKQEIVLDQEGEFGRKVVVAFWGDKATDAGTLKEGEKINVSVNLESREYNGRWFTEVKAWKFGRVGAGAPAEPMPDFATGYDIPEPAATESFDDLPF